MQSSVYSLIKLVLIFVSIDRNFDFEFFFYNSHPWLNNKLDLKSRNIVGCDFRRKIIFGIFRWFFLEICVDGINTEESLRIIAGVDATRDDFNGIVRSFLRYSKYRKFEYNYILLTNSVRVERAVLQGTAVFMTFFILPTPYFSINPQSITFILNKFNIQTIFSAI